MCTSRYWSPSSAKVTAATLQGMKKGVWVLSWCRHAGAWVLSSTTAWSLPFSLGLWTALPKKLQRLDLLQIVFAYIPHNQKARAKLISRMLSLIRLRLIETHTYIYIYTYVNTHIYIYWKHHGFWYTHELKHYDDKGWWWWWWWWWWPSGWWSLMVIMEMTWCWWWWWRSWWWWLIAALPTMNICSCHKIQHPGFQDCQALLLHFGKDKDS